MDADAFADLFKEKLGLTTSVDDIGHDANLRQLLSKLVSKIDLSTMRTRTTQNRVEQTESEGQKVRADWMEKHLLMEEVRALVEDSDTGIMEEPIRREHTQLISTVRKSLAASDCTDCLHMTKEDAASPGLLGLKETDLPLPHLSQVDLHQLNELLSDRLSEKMGRVEGLYTSTTASLDRNTESYKAIAGLAERIQEGREKEKEGVRKAEALRLELASANRELVKNLKSCADSAEEVLLKHKLGFRKEEDKAQMEWLLARSDALCAKLKHIDKQLLAETYTADKIAALRNIKRYLDEEMSRRESELARSSAKLRSYESISLDFDSVVREYRRLLQEISNRKWALKQLVDSGATGDGE